TYVCAAGRPSDLLSLAAQPSRRHRNMKPASHRTRLALEPLEARETPAGVVDVTFARGSVTLIGDAEGNYIGVSTNPDKQVVIGDATHGTSFRLNGADRV